MYCQHGKVHSTCIVRVVTYLYISVSGEFVAEILSSYTFCNVFIFYYLGQMRNFSHSLY